MGFTIKFLTPLFFSILFLLNACAPVTIHYPKVDYYVSQHNFADADQLIKKNEKEYGRNNAVLYYLDRAMMLHFGNEYSKSNQFFAKAEKEIDRLYTRSLAREAGALLTNENLLPYRGEDFEIVMINLISALNYVYLDQLDDALVEARKVDHKLNLLNDKYDKKNVYKEDAYARYLTGILYEAKGELNDAFIAYRKAYEIYLNYEENYGTSVPYVLPGDLLRVTEALGLTEEHKKYIEEFPDEKWISQKELDNKYGEFILFSFDGRSPLKEDYFITVPIKYGKKKVHVIRIALPAFIEQPTDFDYAEVGLISSNEIESTEQSILMEDITAIAKKDLEDRAGRITAKAIARATAKFAASHQVRKKAENNPVTEILANISTNIFSILSEQADKRSWRTLPDQIRMVRLKVLPDSYTVVIKYHTSNGEIIQQFENVTIRAGEKFFLSYRFIGSPGSL